MVKVKVISEQNAYDFERIVQDFLNDDYEILHAFCGVINYTDGSSDSTYKAILTKDEGEAIEICENL